MQPLHGPKPGRPTFERAIRNVTELAALDASLWAWLVHPELQSFPVLSKV